MALLRQDSGCILVRIDALHPVEETLRNLSLNARGRGNKQVRGRESVSQASVRSVVCVRVYLLIATYACMPTARGPGSPFIVQGDVQVGMA